MAPKPWSARRTSQVLKRSGRRSSTQSRASHRASTNPTMLAIMPPARLSRATCHQGHTKVAGTMSTAPGRLRGCAAVNASTNRIGPPHAGVVEQLLEAIAVGQDVERARRQRPDDERRRRATPTPILMVRPPTAILGPEVLPVPARSGTDLVLVLRADRVGTVGMLGRGGHLHEAQLTDLHARDTT